jgi:hypothetical protein
MLNDLFDQIPFKYLNMLKKSSKLVKRKSHSGNPKEDQNTL